MDACGRSPRPRRRRANAEGGGPGVDGAKGPALNAAFQEIFGGEGPRWFSIAAHRPFLDDLAFALDAAFADQGPEALSDIVVLVPTRRAARGLAEAFVTTAAGRAVLLPQIRTLGDLDEGEPPFEPGDLAMDLPAAITPLRRRFELARLVKAHEGALERVLDAPAALELADALARFLDSMQIEEVEIGGGAALDGLVEGDLARHWRRSAGFLAIAVEAWPQRLAELGLVDVAARRAALLRRLAEQWRANPPTRPLVAAGLAAANPAMAELLKAVGEAPHGCVALPGLDTELADSAWDLIGESDAHPQAGLRRLLTEAGVDRRTVRPWPTPESLSAEMKARWRRRVVNEALRPAQATDDWLNVVARLREQGAEQNDDPIAIGLQGLSLATARNEEEGAALIAVLLRETLETPGRTAALVTPDQALARRVSAHLARWDVEVDASAGRPLARSTAGVLAGLLARAVADPLEPATLLALTKHPRVRLGLSGEILDHGRTRLERRGLRGARPKGWNALMERVRPRADAPPQALHDAREATDAALAVIDRLRRALELAAAPFEAGFATPDAAARALAQGLEALAAGPTGRPGDLWTGADGEAAADLLARLMQDGDALPPCSPLAFAQVLNTLSAAETVRGGGASHPRLRVLGLIEARLIGADRMILAGLEEGVWPRMAELDPLLSRPMRARLGLPSPERRVGIAAHDFAQAACAPEVVLVACERRGGQPAVRSRWLWRLETLARGAAVDLPRRSDAEHWARRLASGPADPPESLRPAPRPAPTPPLAARPKALSVTDVERLVRDPYAVYARRVLGLRRLDRPDEPIEARARGTAIHAALDRFSGAWAGLDPLTAGDAFAALYVEELAAQGPSEALMARERVLARRAGAWVADVERERRGACRAVLSELEGEIEVGGVTLSCRADRLEISDRGVHVLDFKTGHVPTNKEMQTDFAPQLTLTAAILMAGGFSGLGPSEPGDLVYLQVKGQTPAGRVEVRAAAGESALAAASALAGLEGLLARYRDPDQPYTSRIATQFMTDRSDYDHLARVREWSAGDEGEDG